MKVAEVRMVEFVLFDVVVKLPKTKVPQWLQWSGEKQSSLDLQYRGVQAGSLHDFRTEMMRKSTTMLSKMRTKKKKKKEKMFESVFVKIQPDKTVTTIETLNLT